MQPITSAASYDRQTIVLHWATALLVAGLWPKRKASQKAP